MMLAMVIEDIFKALGDPTRLRIARLLGTMELAVGELAQVLGQSQPRVSRHVGILCEAGLTERRREGSWVFLRQSEAEGEGAAIIDAAQALLAAAEAAEPAFAALCEADRRKLAAIRDAREAAAGNYFARHAGEWDELRALHSPDAEVERRLAGALADAPIGHVLDIGTGTGRMAELFATAAERVVALDKNLEMLRVARAKLQHLPTARIELVQGDFADLPFADVSFATDPAPALAEAARVLRVGGRIAIVDFANHDHEELRDRHLHARLGFSDRQMADLLRSAGFTVSPPLALEGGELIVKIWIGKRRPAAAGPKTPAATIRETA
jgi:ArsR family transcriptional regulator